MQVKGLLCIPLNRKRAPDKESQGPEPVMLHSLRAMIIASKEPARLMCLVCVGVR